MASEVPPNVKRFAHFPEDLSCFFPFWRKTLRTFPFLLIQMQESVPREGKGVSKLLISLRPQPLDGLQTVEGG
jgi:hypothetical protein